MHVLIPRVIRKKKYQGKEEEEDEEWGGGDPRERRKKENRQAIGKTLEKIFVKYWSEKEFISKLPKELKA